MVTGGETVGSEEGILRAAVVERGRRARKEHGVRVREVTRDAVDSLAKAHTEPEADSEAGILRSIISEFVQRAWVTLFQSYAK